MKLRLINYKNIYR